MERVLVLSVDDWLRSLRCLIVYPGAGYGVRIMAAFAIYLASFCPFTVQAQTGAGTDRVWPAITSQNRPWTRWWWHGSAVDEMNLTASLESYRSVGLGGVEITPIYGVAGYEDRFIEYLSPEWTDRLAFTLREAGRLNLGVDLNNGTGWPFGGPQVSPKDAARYVAYEVYTLNEGERLQVPVRRFQEPLIRAIGVRFDPARWISDSMATRLPGVSGPIGIDDIKNPVSTHEYLQALALDQVRYPDRLNLAALMAYGPSGSVEDLTQYVDDSGRLDWAAPSGKWTLFAVFHGLHGKMVERAAPGGEGLVVDHFSADAVRRYLDGVGQALDRIDGSSMRAFFNDSYEVDDAFGEADWTPGFFEEFQARRGYDLRAHLPALFGRDADSTRVLVDYRQTISDLLLDRFTDTWRDWAHDRKQIVRNQAHGSPGNVLDLYAASDIPETEGNDVLRFKLASSAANVTGKPLIAAEAATWLGEHFSSNLAAVKTAVDRFLLGGGNHIVYHGTAFSPQDAPWPGWLFYAAVHFQPVNPWWTDFAKLNHYVARIQAVLQDGVPDNDVLLYLPMADQYAIRGRSLLVHVGDMNAFEGMPFADAAERLQARGYTFDYISDRQLEDTRFEESRIRTGASGYRTILVPGARSMPVETLARLVELAGAGATILFHDRLPADVPGLFDLAKRRETFQALLRRLPFDESPDIRTAVVGAGRMLLGSDLEKLLAAAAVSREPLVDLGLHFVRRFRNGGTDYFVVNVGTERVDRWIPLSIGALSASVLDPQTGATGFAFLRTDSVGRAAVYLQVDPGESLLLHIRPENREGPHFPYVRAAGPEQPVNGMWKLRFGMGGPYPPDDQMLENLVSWPELADTSARYFSGTATYSVEFVRPVGPADAWRLDLGRVYESVRVRLNGIPIDTLIGPEYRVIVPDSVMADRNLLEVGVSNLMVNRIIYMDQRRIGWKRFYNVNFPARDAVNRDEHGLFDASGWDPKPSGLLGPVTLTPLQHIQPAGPD